MTNLQLSDADHEGLAEALHLMIDDQENYLTAQAEADYGAEWPEAAQRKARMFDAVATIADRMGECDTARRSRKLAKWCRKKAWGSRTDRKDGTDHEASMRPRSEDRGNKRNPGRVSLRDLELREDSDD